MPRKELRAYYRWFFDIMPERLQILTEAVRQTPGYECWTPDQSVASLDPLGAWFAAQVETRPRTPEELAEIESQNPYPIEVPPWQLTNRTFSLAYDIGMYMSQVFLKNHPSLKWVQPLGSKRFIDYGQPVLDGFGAMYFNPVRMIVVLAYGLARKMDTKDSLRELYDIWSEMVQPNA